MLQISLNKHPAPQPFINAKNWRIHANIWHVYPAKPARASAPRRNSPAPGSMQFE
jgi:hypothetical protein